MNISTIIDMIRADPNIVNNVPVFLNNVNNLNVPKQVRRDRVIEVVEVVTSIAELHGGIATTADVSAAIIMIQKRTTIK